MLQVDRVADYKHATGHTPEELDRFVALYLYKGFQPVGDVLVIQHGASVTLAQKMIRFEAKGMGDHALVALEAQEVNDEQ